MVELAQVADVRECCDERYLLVEQQCGTLVRRWFARADDPEQRPLAACSRCAALLLPMSGAAARAQRAHRATGKTSEPALAPSVQ